MPWCFNHLPDSPKYSLLYRRIIIQEAANTFEVKEDGWKALKNRKGGHQDKDTLSSTMSVKQMHKASSNHSPRGTTKKVLCLKAYQEGKEKAIISSHIQICLPIYESTHDLLTLLMRLIVVIYSSPSGTHQILIMLMKINM
ncbi:hypothetical protein BD769DRAFT_1389769 [Suillus cothurnatus]|nr:hypothetical protein BD769DRAFT_1389769 [Suillus cothurnatus]